MAISELRTVCLLGSPRRGCNSDVLANRFVDQAAQHGSVTETFALSDLTYNGCRNLFRCKTDLQTCGQSDDLTAVLAAICDARILVLATPVYFTTVSGQLKLAIDRFFSFFVPDYPTAARKSRLSPDRHLVFLQTQGEPKDKYGDLLNSFSASFNGLGYEHQHLVRACGVRNPGDITQDSSVLRDVDATACEIYQAVRNG